MPVTRIEVLDFVGELFGGTPVRRAALLRAAADAGARAALLSALRTLPDAPVNGPSDLWAHLSWVPEDLQQAREERAGWFSTRQRASEAAAPAVRAPATGRLVTSRGRASGL